MLPKLSAFEHCGASAGPRISRSIPAECGAFAKSCPNLTIGPTRSPCGKATRRSTTCRAAHRSAGVDRLRAKHQGMNPTGSFKDTGMTVAISFARQNEFQVGGLRFDRKHLSVDGRLRRARRHAQPGGDSRRQDCLGQAFAVARLRRPHLPAAHRLRRLRSRSGRNHPALSRSTC